MPHLKRNSKFKPGPACPRQSQRINCQLSTVNCQLFKGGFSLIEIVLSTFLILLFVTVVLSASGTYITSRKPNLAYIAAKIASRDLEDLRTFPFVQLPPNGIYSISDLELAKLPQGQAQRTISDYGGDPKIRQIIVKVTYTENNAPREIKMVSLFTENGF